MSPHTRLSQTYGQWLTMHQWDLFCTFTFAAPTTPRGGEKHLRNYWERLRIITGRDVSVFYALERSLAGEWHAHALVGNIGTFPAKCWLPEAHQCAGHCAYHLWERGIAHVQSYDPNQAGAFYVSKRITPQADTNGFFGTPRRVPTYCGSTAALR